MSSKDWYARKLGVQPPQAPPAVHPSQTQTPQQQQQAQQSTGESALAQGDVVGAAFQWQGGEGTRTEVQKCPQCNSSNYFSRTNRPAAGVNVGGGASGQLVTENGRVSVAARCFDCNYNGLYDLQG